jgi:flagellar biosynthesis anti-sigma factor FlgM
MRIIDSYGKFSGASVDSARQGRPAAGAPKADTVGSPAAGADSVTVSAQARGLAEKAADRTDSARVEHLRSSIQNGTFTIDRQAIANRIVDASAPLDSSDSSKSSNSSKSSKSRESRG